MSLINDSADKVRDSKDLKSFVRQVRNNQLQKYGLKNKVKKLKVDMFQNDGIRPHIPGTKFKSVQADGNGNRDPAVGPG